jgi:hypothetical protein
MAKILWLTDQCERMFYYMHFLAFVQKYKKSYFKILTMIDFVSRIVRNLLGKNNSPDYVTDFMREGWTE